MRLQQRSWISMTFDTSKNIPHLILIHEPERHSRVHENGRNIVLTTQTTLAVRLGKFDNEGNLGDLIRQFAKERVGLDKPVKIDLVGFDREWWDDEARAWGKANGRPKTIETCHTMGIAIGLPGEQRENPIVALGSQQQGDVLCLYGCSGWRNLDRHTVEGFWHRHSLVGFVSELP